MNLSKLMHYGCYLFTDERGQVTFRETQNFEMKGRKVKKQAEIKSIGQKGGQLKTPGGEFSPHCHQDQEAPSHPHPPQHPVREEHIQFQHF